MRYVRGVNVRSFVRSFVQYVPLSGHDTFSFREAVRVSRSSILVVYIAPRFEFRFFQRALQLVSSRKIEGERERLKRIL